MAKGCPSGKDRHASRRAAHLAMYAKISGREGGRGIVGSVYKCPHCHSWHVTKR